VKKYPTTKEPFPQLTKSLYDIVAQHGLFKVRTTMNEITPASTSLWQIVNTGPLHPRINEILLDIVHWTSVGFNK